MTPLQLHLSGAPQSNRSLRQQSDAPSLFLLHSKMIFSLLFFLGPPSISNSPPLSHPPSPSSRFVRRAFSVNNLQGRMLRFSIRDMMMFHFLLSWSGGIYGRRRGREEDREQKETRTEETGKQKNGDLQEKMKGGRRNEEGENKRRLTKEYRCVKG